MKNLFMLCLLALFFSNCKKTETPIGPMVNIKIALSSTQERLNNIGSVSNIPITNAAQTPKFNGMSLHYIEFAPDMYTQFGNGFIAYKSEETTVGGAAAIDFSKAKIAKDGEIFVSVPLAEFKAGTYKWVRASAAYQNYDIKFNLLNVLNIGTLSQESGTLASFLGFNSYITSYKVRTLNDVVNANKKQGYWSFETNLNSAFASYNRVTSGQAPAGATTVSNPLASTSPIPVGSCVITGSFDTPFTITGAETADINVTLSFSINNSFEWVDTRKNGQWDIDVLGQTVEQVVDMGFRGMKAKVEK
jgi:hypothetical protein